MVCVVLGHFSREHCLCIEEGITTEPPLGEAQTCSNALLQVFVEDLWVILVLGSECTHRPGNWED